MRKYSTAALTASDPFITMPSDFVVVRSKGRRLRRASTLNEVAGRLDPRRFVRVHRCFVLNVASLASLELYAKDSRLAVLTDGPGSDENPSWSPSGRQIVFSSNREGR